MACRRGRSTFWNWVLVLGLPVRTWWRVCAPARGGFVLSPRDGSVL